MNKIGLIIGREFLTRVKKKSFIVMTILGPLLFVGFMAGAMYLGMNDNKEYDLVITDAEGLIGTVLSEEDFDDSRSVKYHLHKGGMSDQEFKDSPYDLKIDLVKELIYAKNVNMYYKEAPGAIVTERISDRLERSFERAKLAANNIDQGTYESLTVPIEILKYDIDNVDKRKMDTELGAGIGFALSLTIFMFIFLYGAQIMRGVMEEKTNRIVEVIVSSVKPFQLMLGKIIGVALVGLTQFLLWVALSSALYFAAMAYFGTAYNDPSVLVEQQVSTEAIDEVMAEMGGEGGKFDQVFDFFQTVNFPFIISMFLFYFLGGYLLYGALYAAIGSAVDSEADSQQFMLPIMMPLMFAYIISASAMANPSSSTLYWSSIIPFTSPVAMMVRVGMMGLGYEPIDWLSISISMVLLIVGFIFTTWVAARIYRIGILMYGKKVSYKELWKWLRYY